LHTGWVPALRPREYGPYASRKAAGLNRLQDVVIDSGFQGLRLFLDAVF
jgi:hypothetical protein